MGMMTMGGWLQKLDRTLCIRYSWIVLSHGFHYQIMGERVVSFPVPVVMPTQDSVCA